MSAAMPKPAKRLPAARKRLPRASKPIARKSRPKQQSKSPRAVLRRAKDRRWSELVKAFAGYACEVGLHTVATDAHHLWPKGAHPKLRFTTVNGVALCRAHHDLAHSDMEWFRHFFSQMFPVRAEALQRAMEATR